MIVDILKYTGLFLLLLLLQVFVLNRVMVGYSYGFLFKPQIYIMLILLLPPAIKHNYLILISFFIGLTIDMFTNTMGINAAACTLIGFSRGYITRNIDNEISARDEDNRIWTSKKSTGWKMIYFITLITVHHFIVFTVENLGENFLTRILPTILVSVFLSFFLILMLEDILFKPAKNR
ncbi:MAG: rod shape-determining protein MreD [Bacteroidia bacterium]|nr:rod shape-determining protein MreD [Bacteroidia bacterium]